MSRSRSRSSGAAATRTCVPGRSGPTGSRAGEPVFDRALHAKETAEVQVYLGGGDDRVQTTGKGNDILVRVIGTAGQSVADGHPGRRHALQQQRRAREAPGRSRLAPRRSQVRAASPARGHAVDPPAQLGPRHLLLAVARVRQRPRPLRRRGGGHEGLWLPQGPVREPSHDPRRLGLRRAVVPRGLPRRVPDREPRLVLGLVRLRLGRRRVALLRFSAI